MRARPVTASVTGAMVGASRKIRTFGKIFSYLLDSATVDDLGHQGAAFLVHGNFFVAPVDGWVRKGKKYILALLQKRH